MPGRNTEAAPAVTRLGRDCVRNSTPDLPPKMITQSTDVHACCMNPVSRPHVTLLIWCCDPSFEHALKDQTRLSLRNQASVD